MTGSLEKLKDLRKNFTCPMGLSNGIHVLATEEGTIKLNNDLVLSNVLYVSSLACNLISVPQIVDESNCIAAFSKHMCILQDHTLKMLIGTGEQEDGLYYFQGQKQMQAHKVNRVGSIDLWHARLGHPSHKVIKWIPSNVLNKLCDICHRTKQTRNSFPLSENNAFNLFEMIHCDVWGPYRTTSSCGASYFLTIVDDFSRAIWVALLVDEAEVS